MEKTKTPPRQLCLSVSRRNQRYLDLLEEYSILYNSCMSNTFFTILKEYNTLKIMEAQSK